VLPIEVIVATRTVLILLRL